MQVITCAIRCLIKMFKMPVPSLRQHIATITNRLFVLVSQYAGAGTAKGDNAMLLTSTFKALTILVKNVDYHQISNEQLEVLLGYAEVDIHDHMRQAVAFNLLKAVISRKFSSDGVTGVIKKLLELSIQSDSQNVRLQSRQVRRSLTLGYRFHYFFFFFFFHRWFCITSWIIRLAMNSPNILSSTSFTWSTRVRPGVSLRSK